jgi:hypothetical protein
MEFASLPAEGLNAVLGAPQRAVASEIGNFRSNPAGVLGANAAPLLGPSVLLSPSVRKQVGNEVYAAFHPNDERVEEGAEKATGVNRLMTSDPRFRGKLRNFAVRTGFQTVTDPLNLVAPGIAKAGELALEGIGRAGTAAIKSGSPTARTLMTNVAEREGGYTPEEVSTINSIRNRDITRSRVQHTADAKLLAKNKGALKDGAIPPDVQQRLLREAYVGGDNEMREQAVAHGFKPTPAEAAKPPAGLLKYRLEENYDPHTGVRQPGSFENLLLGEEEKLREPKAGFEQSKTGAPPTAELFDRMQARLAAGRAVTRFRSTASDLEKHLGVTPDMARSLATESKVGGFGPLQALSRAQVDALLYTGLPHMRNVAIMGYNAMGESGIARATQFMLNPSKELLARLDESGGASHFGTRVPGKFSPARILPQVRQATTGALDRWDQALRAARLEQIDKQHPDWNEFRKMDRVNQDLGAYNLKPQYVKLLQGIGANFPQWHDYIALTSSARALLRSPGRVERLARGEQNANDQVFPGKKAPYRISTGGPTEEFASALADPVRRVGASRYPSYFGGSSSIGPIANLLNPQVKPAEFAAGLVPFGPAILDYLSNPYKSPLPPAARSLLDMIGVYSQNKPGKKKHRPPSPRP